MPLPDTPLDARQMWLQADPVHGLWFAGRGLTRGRQPRDRHPWRDGVSCFHPGRMAIRVADIDQ